MKYVFSFLCMKLCLFYRNRFFVVCWLIVLVLCRCLFLLVVFSVFWIWLKLKLWWNGNF